MVEWLRLSRRRRRVRLAGLLIVVGVLAVTVSPAGATPSKRCTRNCPPPPEVVAFWKAIFRMVVFSGNGAWVDVYDWSPTFTRGAATFGTSDVDALADRGVQVLYIQTSRWNVPDDVLDPALLRSIVARAHARRMRVVGWYMPTFADPMLDLRRFGAMRTVGVDGIAVDIEDTTVDLATRNERLVLESALLRWWLPDTPLAAVVLPPVVTDVINPAYWPAFPWTRIAPLYDVWMPMSYWTNRSPESGYRDAYRYTAENIDRLRSNLGRPKAVVSVVGGIADQVSSAEIAGLVRAANERGVIGGSLYDARTMTPGLWEPMLAFRR